MTEQPPEVIEAIKNHLAEADQKVLNLLSITIEQLTPGHAVCRMVVRDDMVNSHHFCHGGLVYTLADTAFAYACSSDNQAVVTLSAHVVYTAAATRGDTLTATAQVVSAGGRTGTCEVEVVNQAGELVARYQGVCYRVKRAVVEFED